MKKLILADNLYSPEEAANIFGTVDQLPFVEAEYGKEIQNFSMIPPDIDDIFSQMLGEQVIVDRNVSGVFRQPMNCKIHFESFNSVNEWCFAVAIQPSTFNLYHHLSGAKTALDGYKFNYCNLFEWDYDVNILLRPGQGVFFRPWTFHSMEHGIIQYFKMSQLQH